MRTVTKTLFLLAMIFVTLTSYTSAQTTRQADTRQAQATETARFGQAQSFSDLSLARYEQQLNAILRARLQEERDFVAAIVRMVGDGKLPRNLVDTSFGWVRKRRAYTNYPFIYFERVLRLQAARLGIAIPAFDFNIYQRRIR